MARTPWEAELEDVVYERVLVRLQREELRGRDRALRERLTSLLDDLRAKERSRALAEALERAWERAAEEVGAVDEPEHAR